MVSVRLKETVNMNKLAVSNLTLNIRTWLRSALAKRIFSVCRWLHIYISCALFSLLLFFCITGITLNHPDWAKSNESKLTTIELPSKFTLDDTSEYPLKGLQTFIEKKSGLTTPRSIDVALEVGEITFDYPLPAGYAFVTVMLNEQIIEIEHTQGDTLALLNDLHKGRHSGLTWFYLIDVTAFLMVLFTITGIVILLQNAKHRRKALVLLLLGSLTPMAVYLAAVPRYLL
ncbi:peptidase [Thalassotalea loyana]|uniref:Peptidase n=2 Tax=Thalassotalea loyana TaxID=280483 RepID=A0ABQ6HH67_9GAMM|nr:peptidase [Thalassotalea loyana]